MKWIAWFDRDENGVITGAGVDSEDRAVNICVTTCENIEVEDKETFNAVVTRDTLLLAAAPEMLEVCESWLRYMDELDAHADPDDPLVVMRRHFHGKRVAATRAAIAKAKEAATDIGGV